MLKVSKALMAVGILLLVLSAVGMMIYAAGENSVYQRWGAALAVTGVALTVAGVAIVLRWQSRLLTEISHSSPPDQKKYSDDVLVQEDLSELVRVVDSRLVSFLETLPNDSITAD